MSNSGNEELFPAGTVVGVHGLRGDVKVRPLSGETSALDKATVIYLARAGSAPLAYPVQRAARHKGNLLLRLEKITDLDAAQTLVGCEVLATRKDLGELPDDEYYWFELEGLRVSDRHRGELGAITEILTTPAHDIYVVRGPLGETLIPAVDAFIVEIDTDRRTMLVDLPEGLIPEQTVDAV